MLYNISADMTLHSIFFANFAFGIQYADLDLPAFPSGYHRKPDS